MPIDWFTVVAQAVNFVVLVWLLKHFLYGPIVRAMGERQDKVSARMEEAEEKLADAEKQRESVAEERERIDEERRRILGEAEEKAESLRQEKLDQAREEARKRDERSREALDERTGELIDELVDHMNVQLVRALEKALSELADADLEDETVGVFVARLGELDDDARDELSAALPDEGATLRTARELSDGQKQRIHDAINELGISAELRFEVDEELICGLELRAGGHRISWSLRAYVREAEQALRDALRDATTTSSEDTRESEGEGEKESAEEQRHAG